MPEEVRDTLGDFHNDLLLHCGKAFLSCSWKCHVNQVLTGNFFFAGIHIEEETEEEEVDTSLRGRLLSLVDKIKSLRKKDEEEKAEIEEEPKPSKEKVTSVKYSTELAH